MNEINGSFHNANMRMLLLCYVFTSSLTITVCQTCVPRRGGMVTAFASEKSDVLLQIKQRVNKP